MQTQRDSESFFRTESYRRLQSEITSSLHADRFRDSRGEEERRRLREQLREARWHFENPGCTGRFQVGLKKPDGRIEPIGLEFDPLGRTRFETRKAALDFIATQTDVDPEMLGVAEVETAPVVNIRRAA
jgi:hypothetical protein